MMQRRSQSRESMIHAGSFSEVVSRLLIVGIWVMIRAVSASYALYELIKYCKSISLYTIIELIQPTVIQDSSPL